MFIRFGRLLRPVAILFSVPAVTLDRDESYRASVGTLSPRKAHLPEPSLLTVAAETVGRLGEPAAS
eukprot:scaffold132109_cov45-Phaeocystis_antarctica.AAC.2